MIFNLQTRLRVSERDTCLGRTLGRVDLPCGFFRANQTVIPQRNVSAERMDEWNKRKTA